MSFHSYDNKKYHFKDTDQEQLDGLTLVEKILGFEPDLGFLKYDFSFRSGGLGSIDQLALTTNISDYQWSLLIKKYSVIFSFELDLDNPLHEEILWLIGYEDQDQLIAECVASFINENKLDFQFQCSKEDEIFFSFDSNINSWDVFWYKDSKLNYLAYDQG